MGVLKNAGLVDDRREGKWVHYSLKRKTQKKEIKTLLNAMAVLSNDNKIVKEDQKKLKKAVRVGEIAMCDKKCSESLVEKFF
jgi:DNA-binding transcriptional ArsR family regulator